MLTLSVDKSALFNEMELPNSVLFLCGRFFFLREFEAAHSMENIFAIHHRTLRTALKNVCGKDTWKGSQESELKTMQKSIKKNVYREQESRGETRDKDYS